MPDIRQEYLGNGIVVCTDREHKVGTDALLLSSFAGVKRTETACDLGCGCGIIPLSWFAGSSAPKKAFGLELQIRAFELARLSAERSNISEQLCILQGDIRDLPAELPKGSFDLVTCNPPYKTVGAGVISAKESGQIARHETTCTLDDVCAAAARLLRFGGRLCICQLPERLPDIIERMRAHRIEPKRLRFVHKNAESAPWLVLAEGKLGSKPFLQIGPPLLLDGKQSLAQYGSGESNI